MRSRLILQSILEEKLGNNRVYFQPPTYISYPCIIYEKVNYNTDYADDIRYNQKVHYSITLIGKNADNEELVQSILDIPFCSFDRRFVTDNLYHDVFNLYF